MAFRKFIATAEQRRFVAVMSGVGMSHARISEVITDPATNRPLNKNTLERVFRQELSGGKSKLQSKILGQWYVKLMNGDGWAIQWGLRCICGLRDDAPLSISIGSDASDAQDEGITVSFIRPSRFLRDDTNGKAGPVIDHQQSQFNGNGGKP
jgi:hypothetical protein